MTQPLTPQTVRAWNEQWADRPAEDRLRFAVDTLSPIGMATSFQISGSVLVDMAMRIRPDLGIFYIDTDYLFEETHECRRRLEAKYGLRFEALRPLLSVAEQAARHGPDLYGTDPDRCCALRKVEPLQRKLATLAAWITGLRREQSDTRKQTGFFEFHTQPDGRPLIKVNPIADWDKKRVWDYILRNDIPYIALYDRGYESIGCRPCTRATAAGPDERAGRWAGFDKTECGIHTFTERKA